MAAVPQGSESHGGDDVMIFARGPFAHLLAGVFEQSYIPHVIGYANGMGPGQKFNAGNGGNGLGQFTMSVYVICALALVPSVTFFR